MTNPIIASIIEDAKIAMAAKIAEDKALAAHQSKDEAEEAEASACLIAAAPELLEQLKEAQKYVAIVARIQDLDTFGKHAKVRQEIINTVIAKAIGV